MRNYSSLYPTLIPPTIPYALSRIGTPKRTLTGSLGETPEERLLPSPTVAPGEEPSRPPRTQELLAPRLDSGFHSISLVYGSGSGFTVLGFGLRVSWSPVVLEFRVLFLSTLGSRTHET